MNGDRKDALNVEVRPEVVFLQELLKELMSGKIRIPKFQRPFVWRRDQMTDLLDSVYHQYPIGSLLVWETDYPVATLERLGPFRFSTNGHGTNAGYLLDGHQRLATLAGALVEHDNKAVVDDDDYGRWYLAWNMRTERFQHGGSQDEPASLFPLTSLLNTLDFFKAVDSMRQAFVDNPQLAEDYVNQISRVAQAFQYYRVPVIRIRQTGLSEAVEILLGSTQRVSR